MEIYILRLMTAPEAADILKVTPKTLKHWRAKGIGPKFLRINSRNVRYEMSDIEAWVDSQKNRSN
jgi:predicted DNA-binding transcriptional regulator AlpA